MAVTARPARWSLPAAALLGAVLTLAGPMLAFPEAKAPTVASLVQTLGPVAALLVVLGAVMRTGAWNAGPAGSGSVLAALGAFVALLAQRLAESAWPELSPSATAPLRSSLQGLTIPLTGAVALGGALSQWLRPSHSARGWLGLGLLGLAVVVLVPQGWLGSSVSPLQAAAFGLDVPKMVDGAVIREASGLSGGAEVLAAAVLAGLGVFTLTNRGLASAWFGGLAVALLGLIAATVSLGGHPGQAIGSMGLLLLGAVGLAVAISPGPTASVRPWQSIEWAVVAAIVGAWLILKVNGTRYSTTDESLYYYAAKLWSEGKWPYRDFFFSHPPLHIAVPALAYKLLGYDFWVGKWLSVVASLGAGLAVWRIARTLLGVPAGLLALSLDLFAAETLQASTNLTGVNLTTCWMMWGVWAVLRGRWLLGGALLGAAAATGFYALGMVLALAGMLAFLPWGAAKEGPQRLARHPAVRVMGGFLGVWGTLTAMGILLAGDGYTQGVFAYHFAKKAKVDGFLPISGGPPAWLNNLGVMLAAKDFTVVLYYHAVHLWLALISPVAVAATVWLRSVRTPAPTKGPSPWNVLWNPRLWWDRPDPGHRVVIFVATAAMVGEFAQFKERYDFYWALILPLLSICAAGVVVALADVGALLVDGSASVQGNHKPVAWAWAVTLALLCLSTMPLNNAANTKAYPSEFVVRGDSKGAGEVLTFEWLDAPGPAWISEFTRAVFWSDTRIRGNIESGVHHYLWNKKRWYSVADDMAAWIRDHTRPDETITGASDYAPLLALLSGRRLAGDHVDTNSKVFDTRMILIEKFWDDACKDNLKYVVVAPMSYFAAAQLPKRRTIMEHFVQEKVFRDPKLKHWKDLEMELWVRKSDGPCKFEGVRTGGTAEDVD